MAGERCPRTVTHRRSGLPALCTPAFPRAVFRTCVLHPARTRSYGDVGNVPLDRQVRALFVPAYRAFDMLPRSASFPPPPPTFLSSLPRPRPTPAPPLAPPSALPSMSFTHSLSGGNVVWLWLSPAVHGAPHRGGPAVPGAKRHSGAAPLDGLHVGPASTVCPHSPYQHAHTPTPHPRFAPLVSACVGGVLACGGGGFALSFV
jgi:hypothetical protein